MFSGLVLFAVTGIDHAQLVRRVGKLKGDKHQHISGTKKTKVSEKCSFLYFLVVLLIICCCFGVRFVFVFVFFLSSPLSSFSSSFLNVSLVCAVELCKMKCCQPVLMNTSLQTLHNPSQPQMRLVQK